MTRALILSGGGDLSDPWHPFAETSAAVAELLGGADVVDTIDEAVGSLASGTDLLVVNAGNAKQGHPLDGSLLEAIGTHVAQGRPLLALHVSATLFPGLPEWEALLGGRWIRGTTMHPERGLTEVDIVPGHPITEGLEDFVVDDERYSWLRVDPTVSVLASQEYEGQQHPLAWAHGERVIYDALGHDAASYASAARADLLRREVSWLLR